MPATQSSPWAGVPFNPDVTMADMQPQSSVWAAPDEQQQAINIPQMSQGPQLVPKIDLHKPMTQIFAPAPEPSAQDEIAGNLKGRLEKDYEKDANPMGSENNHPGFFGKLAHGLSHALGGDTRRQWEEQGLAKNINDLESDESLNRERNATAGHTEAETPEVAPNAEATRGLQGAETEHLGAETDALKNPQPNLATAYAHAVNQALASGKDPAQDPVVQHLADAITSLQPGQNKPEGPAKTTDIELPGQGVHTMGWDEKTQKYDIDEGKSGFKPAVTRVSLGEGRMEKNDLLKAFQPSLDSAERMNVMTDAYEKAVKGHDQQAMLNLLANHIGMTMGLAKGARITQHIYDEAAQSMPWIQKVGAKFDDNGYLSGVTLSQPQMKQMVGLAQERYAEDTGKSRSTAKYLGGTDDGPERIPGKSTINYYLGLSGGDPAKAKQLAAQDGWSVK